jgi:branched-chain amino acid transport system substrate-binding protein
MRTKLRSVQVLAAMSLLLLVAACVEQDPADTAAPVAEAPEAEPEAAPEAEAEIDPADIPDEIVFGNAIALTGPNNAGASLSQIPSYDLWAEDVNAEGGIYVEEYDARIPVRIHRVDDTSDVGTAVQLVQQMLADDSIHFILPPWGTASNFAIAQDVSDAQMPVLGCTVGSKDLIESAEDFPYFYAMLNQPDAQGAGLVELLVELEVETVGIMHHDDLFGIEFNEFVEPALVDAGIEVVHKATYPANTEDLSTPLRAMQEANPQALLSFTYPGESFLVTNQAREIGFNPDLFMAAVGVAFPAYRNAMGPAAEGVIGTGAWNPNVDIEGAREYFDRHVEMHDAEPDRWASAACYATGQVYQQAIEAAGTLDRVAVKEALDTNEFQTILGTFQFENQLNRSYPGQIGQWQDGEFEIVSPTENRTADPIFPKPEWPSD